MPKKTIKKTTNETKAKKTQDSNSLEPIKSVKTITPENILEDIKINLKYKVENQKKFVHLMKNKDMVICTGPAGVGKTYLTCAEAINQLKENPLLEQIILVKSVTTLKNEEIGYLKGGIKEKMEPFIYSFMNNFKKIIGHEKASKLEEFRLLEIIPIAYMRGINIDNAFIIIDETQNISIDNIHTIMTRLGTNSKMIFLGDINQIDTKKKDESALQFLLDDFNEVNEIGIIEFTEDDIVRHPLVKKIEEIFKKKREQSK